MKRTPTAIEGVEVIEIEPAEDERGFFARTWDSDEQFDYSCVSRNTKKHTLRGMHYQRAPHGEVKLVRCTKGRVFDVVIDMRSDSPTYTQWHGEELSEENHKAMYIPEGCAHGFLSLEDDTEVLYMIRGAYNADSAAGVRWNDPAFGIDWPAQAEVLSERDATYEDVSE